MVHRAMSDPAAGTGQLLQSILRQIGVQIDPGVPWCHAIDGDGRGLHLALKSGNFGATDFFCKA